MLDVVSTAIANHGAVAGGGLAIVSAGMWLRRLQALDAYLRMGSVLLILLGLGTVSGVVDLGRLAELARTLWELAAPLVARL